MDKFVAVAYCPDTRLEAYKLVERLTPEQCVARRSKHGVRRFILANRESLLTPGCDRVLVRNDYGSANWRVSKGNAKDGTVLLCDFKWQKIADGLYGGEWAELSDERKTELAERAKKDAEQEKVLRATEAQTAQEQASSEQADHELARKIAECEYIIAIADMAGVRNPTRLDGERLGAIAAIADVPIKLSQEQYITLKVGPEPEQGWSKQFELGAPDADIDAEFDNAQAAVVRPTVHRKVTQR